ncbi:hypothetical protein L6164_025357 [Bauhinia variegata]|uniref:Uncharacterized protein n=1 Tax=Bauhinia variegata TaxID=167791 RepID=A0ACB9M1Q1_BAUVA|nr:hypothetical protein L6164_025357 [Bauhinia variegata]
MFSSIPKADAVFLKWILHAWGDKESIKILRKCREAIPKENGRVIIVDAVIDEFGNNEDRFKDVKLMIDMVMMAQTTTGKERTLKEWDYVIKEAGFSRYTVKSIHAMQSVIMWILHAWGDKESIKILRKCREAIPKENGRVIIVDAVIDEFGNNEDRFKDVKLMIDMVMMAQTTTGKERTLKEWDYVIKEAGFSRYTVKSIHAMQSVIMVFP